MLEIRVTGKEKKQAQAFLTVLLKRGFGKLIHEHTELLKAKAVKIKIKNTIVQHTTRIRVFIGMNDEFVNTKYQEEKVMNTVGYKDNIFKLLRAKVCEKDISSKCLVVNATMDNREKIDQDLQEINLGDNFTYISFCYC